VKRMMRHDIQYVKKLHESKIEPEV